MALIIENGIGIADANSYATNAFVLTYLTDRNRATENSWSTLTTAVQDANIIASTDYIENRFRDLFKGFKEFKALKLAKGLLTFGPQPLASSIVTLGTTVYTFVSTLTTANDVLIDINTSATITNLIDAVNADPLKLGVTVGIGTVAHADIAAKSFDLDTFIAEAKLEGLQGNLLATTTDVVGATWTNTTLTGGTDAPRPQPLSFPRIDIFDREGTKVLGIPERLKMALAEYAVRAADATLSPDPDVTTGRALIEKTEKVDVIQETNKWQEGGGVITIIPYPAADNLLSDFLRPSGLVLR